MEKLRVILINYMESTAPGGINKVIQKIAANLSKKGHEIIIIQPNPFNLSKEELFNGFKIIRINSNFESYLYGLNPEMQVYLKKILEDLNPDIIHVHGYHSLLSIQTIRTIRNMKKDMPIIFSPYLDVYRSTIIGKYFWNLYNFLAKTVFNKTSHIICCSDFESEMIINDYNIKKDKISIIPLGVEFIEPLSTISNKSDKTIKLIYSGYLIKRKGVEFILESINKLVYHFGNKNVELIIIGEGPERKKLLNLAKKLKVDPYIIWEPFLNEDDLIKNIKNSDIFLLLSHSEAYGIIISEALALGTRCIVTKRTALMEFLNEPGCYGVDYPPDPINVAQLILEVTLNNRRVGKLTQKIRLWDEVIDEYENLYMKMILQ